nr:hypothetical protein CFP56_48316 [Quercus suber]
MSLFRSVIRPEGILNSKPRRIIKGSDNRLDLKILVKGFKSRISSKPTHLIPTKRAVMAESKIAIDPNGAGTE